MKKIILFSLLIFTNYVLTAQKTEKDYEHRYDAPWQQKTQQATTFIGYGIDNAPDFHGDINNPDLVIFFAGNQYMVVPELLAAFKKEHPEYTRVFAETIPPGIEESQQKSGTLVFGNMKITLQPDVVTAGKSRIIAQEKTHVLKNTYAYAKNKLAIMVQKGNPKNIKSLIDLARADVKVSMPNPKWEGIATRIVKAYENVGGPNLTTTIMENKVEKNNTFLTTIHHRETPLRIMYNNSDAGPVWYTEAYYHSKLTNHPIDMITIPDENNVSTVYMAGIYNNAPHPKAANQFIAFLATDLAQNIYKKYGFDTIKN
ncbi:substrate-binding domain-containing protein [Wenyingzhuangia sp. 2_MG-2023]|uniref:molybdate ABC transporter substrate-binding protein n=1 Tax=Wenyingzhuangia sp. 2_MG-2023 TaxID=3062639 RepID=UPI0026E317DD|nr:substrate-binding domain-containing protein [Wenyingzhuangia sp. 2_MG-2023]MDO6737301.1 substrate-binding domain-containing protein [Wenyingzhuangia sp. 2_MG-2023]MDO6801619.1 substrate-binding domain-containing protein [Wenyingzhuangia sp. 1_MG-2023]